MTARISGHSSLRNRSALALEEQRSRTVAHVHAATAALLDQPFIDQLLITLEHREGVQPVVGGHRAHRGQRVTLLERPFQDEGDHSIAQLAINGLVVIPIGIHAALSAGPPEGAE